MSVTPIKRETTGFTQQEDEAAVQLLNALGIAHTASEEQYAEYHRHAMVMAKCLSLLWAKRGYGQSWRAHGYLGSVLKISMKSTRLMNLLWYAQGKEIPGDSASEDASDTFLDLANYAVFGYEQWKADDERGTRPVPRV